MFDINKIKKSKFHTMGTKLNTQVKKLRETFVAGDSLHVDEVTNSEIYVCSDSGKRIMFKSKTTQSQFIFSLMAMNYLKPIPGKYEVNNLEIEIDNQIETIFDYSNDKSINIYRQSRIICILYTLGYISEKYWNDLMISGKRSLTRYNSLKNESSFLGKELKNKNETIEKFLRKLEKYEFTK